MLFFSAPSLALVCVYMCFLHFFFLPSPFLHAGNWLFLKQSRFTEVWRFLIMIILFDKRFSSHGELEFIQLHGETNKARRGGRVLVLILFFNPKSLTSLKFGENSQASNGENGLGWGGGKELGGGGFLCPLPRPCKHGPCAVFTGLSSRNRLFPPQKTNKIPPSPLLIFKGSSKGYEWVRVIRAIV